MYVSVTFKLKPFRSEFTEILIALLDEGGYEGICETDTSIIAYIPKADFDRAGPDQAVKVLRDLGCEASRHIEVIEDQNWNRIWESHFDPVVVNDQCAVRAPFHPAYPDIAYDIVIEPKMAFGTAHHQTTRLMIEEMLKLDLKGKKVLDMGCGTGILAILASLMGAGSIFAVDTDERAIENTQENVRVNQCANVRIVKGSAEAIPEGKYDLILANINRNVLMQHIPTYADHLAEHGRLVLSGILANDESLIRGAAEGSGLHFLNSRSLDNWMVLIFQRN